jgi:hypothetical protein
MNGRHSALRSITIRSRVTVRLRRGGTQVSDRLMGIANRVEGQARVPCCRHTLNTTDPTRMWFTRLQGIC